jgi:hypothetical protein
MHFRALALLSGNGAAESTILSTQPAPLARMSLLDHLFSAATARVLIAALTGSGALRNCDLTAALWIGATIDFALL